MRKALLLTITLLAAVVMVAAQDQPQSSLGDVARQQKAKDKPKPAHVFTNDNLPTSGDAVSTGTGQAPGAAPAAAPAASGDDDAKAAAAKPAAKGKVDQERVKAAQAEVAKWQKELQDLDKIKGTLDEKIASAPNDNVRGQYQEMLGHVPMKVGEAQQKLAAAQKELEAAQSGEGGDKSDQANAPADGQAPPQGETPANPPTPNSGDAGNPQ